VLSENFFRVIAYPILIAAVSVMLVRMRGHRIQVLFGAVFAIYLIEVAAVTLFPMPVNGLMAEDFRSSGISALEYVNFIPGIPGFTLSLGDPQVIQNVIVGIPFGFGAFFVLPGVSARRVLLSGVLAFAGIEAVQATIGVVIGFPYRVIDINDVLANSVGVAIGVVAFIAFAAAYRAADANRRLGDTALLGYIRQVVPEKGMRAQARVA
jgi:glycopeptide antibiotics resistance protein